MTKLKMKDMEMTRKTGTSEFKWNCRTHFINKNQYPMTSGASEWAVRANERAEERMAQYFTRRFYSHSTHRAAGVGWLNDGRIP